MKKIMLGFMVLLLLVGLVSAQEVTRAISATTAAAGTTFTVTYTANGFTAPYLISVKTTYGGGCTDAGYTTSGRFINSPGTTSSAITITAPNSAGTCTISSNYQVNSGSIIPLTDANVAVTGSSNVVQPTPTPGASATPSATPSGSVPSSGLDMTTIGILAVVAIVIYFVIKKK